MIYTLYIYTFTFIFHNTYYKIYSVSVLIKCYTINWYKLLFYEEIKPCTIKFYER